MVRKSIVKWLQLNSNPTNTQPFGQTGQTSDFTPASSKELLDIQATIECGFTLKRVHDMTRTYSLLLVLLLLLSHTLLIILIRFITLENNWMNPYVKTEEKCNESVNYEFYIIRKSKWWERANTETNSLHSCLFNYVFN